MSEKFRNGWRKVEDGAVLVTVVICFIPLDIVIVAIEILVLTVIEILNAAVKGLIFSVCWNVARITIGGFLMFEFPKVTVTIFQASVLAFAIAYLRYDYFVIAKLQYESLFVIAKLQYESLTEKPFKDTGMVEEKILRVVVAVLHATIFEFIMIFIAVFVTRYSWNNILPQILNIELIHINFWQALLLAWIINSLFEVPESNPID